MALGREPYPTDEQVIEAKHKIITLDALSTTVSRLATSEHRSELEEGDALQPAVLHIFDGGMISWGVEIFTHFFRRNTSRWDVQAFAVDYRASPENPAPGPVEDVYAALKKLSANAKDFGVDHERLIIHDYSAGGGRGGHCAAGEGQRTQPAACKADSDHPMLDDGTIGRYGPQWPVTNILAWDENSNKIGWCAYVGEDKAGKDSVDVSIYATQERARVENLVGLPRTYIDTPGVVARVLDNRTRAIKPV